VAGVVTTVRACVRVCSAVLGAAVCWAAYWDGEEARMEAAKQAEIEEAEKAEAARAAKSRQQLSEQEQVGVGVSSPMPVHAWRGHCCLAPADDGAPKP
jgi:hypothetical protein